MQWQQHGYIPAALPNSKCFGEGSAAAGQAGPREDSLGQLQQERRSAATLRPAYDMISMADAPAVRGTAGNCSDWRMCLWHKTLTCWPDRSIKVFATIKGSPVTGSSTP